SRKNPLGILSHRNFRTRAQKSSLPRQRALTLPTTQAPQRRVARQALQQLPLRLQVVDRRADKRARNRPPIFLRPFCIAIIALEQTLDLQQLENCHQLFLLLTEFSYFLRQPGKQSSLYR